MTRQLSENQQGRNNLAVAACAVGLVSLLVIAAAAMGLIPLPVTTMNPLLISLLVSGCAVVLGGMALKKIKTDGQHGRGLAIAGCALGAIGLVIASLIARTLSQLAG
ncbi:DUF4190 domain-containing protein [Micromonospora sp. NPDC000668]|uniref:DUF4190 domain-containing protein n=1 Tax=Micromonospora sp. NPDC000668 TaxID=3364219 RepID=UPI0036841403